LTNGIRIRLRGSRNGFPWAKFGKEIVAGALRRPKWAPDYSAHADLGYVKDAQALLRLKQQLLMSGG
jgi:hypothetical protein